ncbi:hypothetical protein ACLVWU_05640 [Bdellovibrio sp. HCB290]|uniref:hypothetical protein n=1 Tax=Bdellovibrio sp. HCB290 TaxID=3394356 RepID=UPI0039B40DFF
MKHLIACILMIAASTSFAGTSEKSKQAVLSSPEVQAVVLTVAKMRGLECSTPKLDNIQITAVDGINEKFSVPVMCNLPVDPTTGQGGAELTSVTVTGYVYSQTHVRVFGMEIKEFE